MTAPPLPPVPPAGRRRVPGTDRRTGGVGGLARGWNPASFSGAKADYFVDGEVAASGDGTSPARAFRTVGEAIARVAADVAAGGTAGGVRRTVAVIGKDAIYRERISLAGCDGLTLRGFGTDKPTITGQDVLDDSHPAVTTGWAQCSAADAARLGPALGIDGSPVWKITIRDSAPAAGVTALNIYEAGEAIPVCQVRQPGADLFFRAYNKDYVVADEFVLNERNEITGIVDTDVLGGLTDSQLVGQAFVYVYAWANIVYEASITAYDGISAISVDQEHLFVPKSREINPDSYWWNLCNCLPKLVKGTQGAYDNGDGTITIYLWPMDAANIAADITFAARDMIIDAPDVRDVTVEGLRLIGTAGSGQWGRGGNCINTERSHDVTVRHCLIGNVTHKTRGSGAVVARQTRNFRLERCELGNIASAFTAYFSHGPNKAWSHGTVVRQNRCRRLSQTAFRFFGQRNVQMVFNDVAESGYGGHSNAWNFYLGCDTVLVYGNRFRNVIGYGTWQEATNIFVGMNLQQANIGPNDSRAIQDQSRLAVQAAIADPGSTNYVWNNHVLPDPNDLEGGSSVNLGRARDDRWEGPDETSPFNNRFVFVNNIVHGGGVVEPYLPLGAHQQRWEDRPGFGPGWVERDRRGNLYTELSWWQSARYGWYRDPTELVATHFRLVYADAARGDFRAAAQSPVRTHRGVGLGEVLAAARAAFPGFNFNVDCDGLPIPDTDAPAVGCFQQDYQAQIADD